MFSFTTPAASFVINWLTLRSTSRPWRGGDSMAVFESERMMAIVERDMRKFFRSPALMIAAMVFPLVQLIVLGNAFGGKIRDAKLGIVDQDHGPQAVRVVEALRAVQSNARTFEPIV